MVSFFWFLYACPAFGQAAKAALSDDYSIWSTLQNGSISATGKWVSYRLLYEAGLDTLFAKATAGNDQIIVPKGKDGRFVKDDYFFAVDGDKLFKAWNLRHKTTWQVKGVSQYFIGSNKFVLLERRAGENQSVLELHDMKGTLLKEIDGVTNFSVTSSSSAVAYCTASADKTVAEVLKLDGIFKVDTMARKPAGSFGNFVWSRNEEHVAFTDMALAEKTEAIYLYSVNSKKCHSYRPDAGTSAKWRINAPYAENIKVPDSGTYLIFTATPVEKEGAGSFAGVQIWNASDKTIYPRRITEGSPQQWIRWDTSSGGLLEIGGGNLRCNLFTGDYRYAFCYDEAPYSPSEKNYPDQDCYSVDLATGESALVAKGISGSPEQLKASPNSARLVYVLNDEWMVYDADLHKSVTIKSAAGKSSYRFEGWASDGQQLFFYDANDIWETTAGFSGMRRLTTGNENGMVYRAADDSGILDSKNILLKIHRADYDYSGYAILAGNEVRQLIYQKSKVSALRLAGSGSVFSYVTEDFDQPPVLRLRSGSKDSKLTGSNLQFRKYRWGKSESFGYKVGSESLKGVLCYPFDYDPAKRYPMVVHVYEKQNHLLHQFVNPSLCNLYGFNVSLLTSRGYFVFFPDISPEIGKVGMSAVAYVVAATKAVLEARPIDRERIGLLGHSFGGYETNFSITQTDLFRAAVSGAGISDYTSAYFTMDKAYRNTAYWRFESDQRRMGSSYFENPEGYLENSPIYHAAKITTPLLQFVGDNDPQVDPAQSYEFHLALRRLGKENILLVYPKEGHVLFRRDNQIDLSLRILDWFDHYLKNKSKPFWAQSK